MIYFFHNLCSLYFFLFPIHQDFFMGRDHSEDRYHSSKSRRSHHSHRSRNRSSHRSKDHSHSRSSRRDRSRYDSHRSSHREQSRHDSHRSSRRSRSRRSGDRQASVHYETSQTATQSQTNLPQVANTCPCLTSRFLYRFKGQKLLK